VSQGGTAIVGTAFHTARRRRRVAAMRIAVALLVVAGCSKSLAEETKSKAESFRSRICKCEKGDQACVDKVEAEHRPWSAELDQKLDGKVTQEEYYAISMVEEAYRACLDERR
jgi:hypothetical protein